MACSAGLGDAPLSACRGELWFRLSAIDPILGSSRPITPSIECAASLSSGRFRAFDACQPSSKDKTLLMSDKLSSPRAAARLSHGTRDLSVIRIKNLEI
jgi:hypothetical protein